MIRLTPNDIRYLHKMHIGVPDDDAEAEEIAREIVNECLSWSATEFDAQAAAENWCRRAQEHERAARSARFDRGVLAVACVLLAALAVAGWTR